MKTIESEIINRLRLPLMLLVVLLHSNIKNVLNYKSGGDCLKTHSSQNVS